MTRTIPKLLYGDRLTQALAGSHQLVAIPASQAATPPIQVDRYCRNAQRPDARFISSLNEHGNQAALFRTKEYFSCVGRIGALGAVSSGDRPRWRFAFHTGQYQHMLCAIVSMLPTDINIDPGASANSFARLDIYEDNEEASLVDSAVFTYGVHPLGTSGGDPGFQHIKVLTQYIAGLDPDTDYYATFVDSNFGRLQSATVFELASLTEHFDGYLPQNITAQTAMFDVYRANLAELQREVWKKSGAKVFSWSLDDGTLPEGNAFVLDTTSGTPTNIIDGTSTTFTADTPGFTIDMRHKDRVSQTDGVPCTIKAFGAMESGFVGTDGTVELYDSAGNVLIGINEAWSDTPSWQVANVVLPATLDKINVMFSTSAGKFYLYAVTCYEDES